MASAKKGGKMKSTGRSTTAAKSTGMGLKKKPAAARTTRSRAASGGGD